MIQAIQTAIAGLRASAYRLGVAADNIANVNSSGAVDPYDGYQPQRVVQTTNSLNSPQAKTQPVSPAYVPVYQPDDPRANADGVVGYPNVDLAANIVDLTIAQRTYEANLVTLRVASDMTRVLLDRTA